MRKKAIILAIISIVYIIGFPLLKNKVLDARYTIVLEVTGEANALSKGTEIWIDSIYRDGAVVDITKLALDAGWENRVRLFNPGTEAGKWFIVIRSKKNTRIDFVTHPYSGIVRITDYEGNVSEFDLYSEEEDTKSLILNY